MHALDKLEPAQLELPGMGIQHVLDRPGDLRVCSEFLEAPLRVRGEVEDRGVGGIDRDVPHTGVVVSECALGEGDECRRLRDQDANEVVLERVSVYVELLNDRACRVGIFELLQRDILPLRELHNVLGESCEVRNCTSRVVPAKPTLTRSMILKRFW